MTRWALKFIGFLLLLFIPMTFVGSTASPATNAASNKSMNKWRGEIAEHPPSEVGCFDTSYPSLKWHGSVCSTPPADAAPMPASQEYPPDVVGDGTDYVAAANDMTSATGSFSFPSGESPSSVSETGINWETGNSQSNIYTLQLNVQWFSSSLCSQLSGTCSGWQQFVYDAAANAIYMQYWLVDNSLTASSVCPGSGFQLYISTSSNESSGCFQDSTWYYLANASPPINVPAVSDLPNVQLTGSAISGGNDVVTMTVNGEAVSQPAPDSVLFLAGNWNDAEFGIFGDGNGTAATFSAGTTLNVKTTTHNASTAAPSCLLSGYTAETNNLNLSATAPATGPGSSPYLESTQSQNPGSQPSCASARGINDTHFRTFLNLFYDFQEGGDFYDILSTDQNPDFIVQAQQISAAPYYPNAFWNQAVATQLGSADVCISGTELEINGKPATLTNGVQYDFAGGGDITQYGDSYLMMGRNGDSVLATVDNGSSPAHVNVYVGLPTWPVKGLTGLLVNANDNVDNIATRTGTVYTVGPFNFNDFYGTYGPSWTVPSDDSLLSCVSPAPLSKPTQVMYANNLPKGVSGPAEATCQKAGVRSKVLLNACTVDVAVSGEKSLANDYVGGWPKSMVWGKIADAST